MKLGDKIGGVGLCLCVMSTTYFACKMFSRVFSYLHESGVTLDGAFGTCSFVGLFLVLTGIIVDAIGKKIRKRKAA